MEGSSASRKATYSTLADASPRMRLEQFPAVEALLADDAPDGVVEVGLAIEDADDGADPGHGAPRGRVRGRSVGWEVTFARSGWLADQ